MEKILLKDWNLDNPDTVSTESELELEKILLKDWNLDNPDISFHGTGVGKDSEFSKRFFGEKSEINAFRPNVYKADL